MISPIERLTPITDGIREPGLAAENPNMFRAVFQSAIDHVKETDAQKVEAEYLLATGQLVASSKSELAVSLLVQLRNKALDAYSELTRISL